MSGITVIKRNIAGEETWRYSGQLLKRTENMLVLEALFNLDDFPFMGVILKRGDLFREVFFINRWYNVFEIHDRDDGVLKGWYCNISRPAVLEAEDCISFVDLALDLWVAPDGVQTVVDEDEFEALDMDKQTRDQAIDALDQLKMKFLSTQPSTIFFENQ
jgi:hypothetical protein